MKSITTELNNFRPVITYEATLGRSSLLALRLIFFVLWVLCVLCLTLYASYRGGEYNEALLGSALIFFALWLEQILIYCYHNSFYFRGFDSIIGSGSKDSSGISYEVAQVVLANEHDVTAAFMCSPLGLEIMIRSGMTKDTLRAFMETNRSFVSGADIPLVAHRTTDLYDLGMYLYMYDVNFKNVLEQNAIRPEIYAGALQLVVKKNTIAKRAQRWWSRDRLSLHRGLGRELSTGIPYELERFSSHLAPADMVIDKNHTTPAQTKLIRTVEQVLARNRAANVLLVSEAGGGTLDILAALEARVVSGDGLNALAGLEFLVLDCEQLLTTYQDKYPLEEELVTIFNQAAAARTIVVIIPNLSQFIENCARLEVDIMNLLDIYLTLPTLHFIGIDTPHNYHTHLRPHDNFMRRFEEILVTEVTTNDTVAILEPIALRQEGRRGVLFTYGAIVSIAETAERYLTEGTMPERAIDLVHAVAKQASQQGVVTITSEQVMTFVSEKTGIPVGPVSDSEKDRLLNLESILHERVVGQEAAVGAIARTMRRARVDIERSDKPIGSFLFLGPTGVGKTETAKALAFTFFGDENKMVRFDMSEFSGPHTLGHLIGDENGTGILTDKMHEHPYCVLLLDEFEKAAPAVHDLFLQILDEGFFTSHAGVRVNVRNTIIIATSNAGSDLIRKTASIRAELPNLDADIITHIIERGIFKPELINRFDSTIIFEPLDRDELGGVAKLLVRDLTKRVLDRGYHLSLTPELLALLVTIDYDPNSGGRGIGRALQDILEEKIAQKIISGEVQIGGYLHLSPADFSTAELRV